LLLSIPHTQRTNHSKMRQHHVPKSLLRTTPILLAALKSAHTEDQPQQDEAASRTKNYCYAPHPFFLLLSNPHTQRTNQSKMRQHHVPKITATHHTHSSCCSQIRTHRGQTTARRGSITFQNHCCAPLPSALQPSGPHSSGGKTPASSTE